MKTLKKILVMCMTLVVMVGVTGCVDSDKQDRLLQFINVDLSEAKELETEANDAYPKVKEDENSGVKWVPITDVLETTSEPWVRDRVYAKIINKMKKDGIIR